MGPAALTDLDAASRRWVLGLRLVRTAVAALALIALVACGSGGGTPAPAPVPPRITSVTPTSGIPGVTLVTLEGTGFDLAKVRFASQDAPTFETADGLRIVVRVPVGAVTGPITVETPVGSHASGPFTVLPVPPPLPEVTGFAPAEGSPDGGPALPGTLVTVTGTGLTRVREVVFGTAAGVITGGDDATQVSARVPANAQTGRIRVVTAAGEAASTAEFTVRPLAPSPEPPEITGFTPAEGAPGTRVTLTGKGFYGASQANLGTQVAPGHEVLNDTLMVVTIPNGAVTGAFSVAAPGGSRASSTEFKVLPPVPQGVTGISLDTGGPGQLVRLSGTGFQDARQVNFGQVRATEVTVVSDNLLTAVVPAGATTGPISVVTGERVFESAPFTVTDGGTPHAGLPVVQGLAPDHAAVGRAVTVTGSGLGGVTRVAFAGLVATGLQRIDDSSFIVTVPPAAVSGTLAVVTPAGIARSGGFTVDLPPPPPEVASFSPDRGAPGSTVTLGGSGFTGATAVTFNGAAAPPPYAISADGTSLVVTVPAAAASGRVTVVAPGGTGASQRDFQVDPPPAPAATTVAPLQGRPGTPVTLSGTLLGQVAAVLFGTVEGVPTTVAADGSQLTVPVPAGAGAGVLALSLRTATGTVVPVPGPGFAVEPPPPPGITSFSPDHGIPGTEVVVLGAHFTGVTQVAFAGAALPAARYDLDDDGRLRVRIPDDALADGALAVTTAAGTDATLGNFTVLPSRLRTYQEPLVEVLQPIFGVRQLDFPVERRTAQYAYGFPKAPVLHAYHLSPPAGGHGEVAGRTLPTFTLNLKLPSTFFAALPASVRNQIAVLGIPPGPGGHLLREPELPVRWHHARLRGVFVPAAILARSRPALQFPHGLRPRFQSGGGPVRAG